ncbi:MAG: FkbM family methyltransferase [Candidatus Pacebacteria bacterium]|nr:FkbM family methyltransferase [Candidatus Paceibacterota bacterium]
MNIELIGNPSYGAWNTITDGLSENSIVYSLGVGDDVSWDLELIRKFGCKVFAFDPTPYAIEWISKQQLPDAFRFFPVGISDHDGTSAFFTKKNVPTNKNLSTLIFDGDAIELPVKRLATVMKELGHGRIDILKMDIEGSEYAVIRDMRNIVIRQLLVEMHNPTSKRLHYPIARLRLWMRGFREFAKHQEDHSFIHV